MNWHTALQSSGFGVDIFSGTTGSVMGERVIVPETADYKSGKVVIALGAALAIDVDSDIPPEFSAVGGFQYSVWFNKDGLNIQSHEFNGEGTLSKPFSIAVVYKK